MSHTIKKGKFFVRRRESKDHLCRGEKKMKGLHKRSHAKGVFVERRRGSTSSTEVKGLNKSETNTKTPGNLGRFYWLELPEGRENPKIYSHKLKRRKEKSLRDWLVRHLLGCLS